jgi:Acyl-CoA reductase (LuxC)
MTLTERINALTALGTYLNNLEDDRIQAVIHRTAAQNSWFTVENQLLALAEIRDNFLQKEALETWTNAYPIPNPQSPTLKTVALILAGNIPLVGFHDVLSVFVAGHRSLVKLSEKDPFLLPFLFQILKEINPETPQYFATVEGKMTGFDAVIATGSNNSARYFEAYFGKYPNIIRKNRNAVAILRGDETTADLQKLGDDIFQYFGLGCRNVSKIFIPHNYDFVPLLETLHERNDLILHDKYKNNFDYNFALLILNRIEYKSNGCILLREAISDEIASPISVVFFQYYKDFEELTLDLTAKKEEIQLVVSRDRVEGLPTFGFGEAQKPSLTDYADGVDTLAFLTGI